MGRKRTPGLIKRGGNWHVDKQIKEFGRLRESCGTGDLAEAERYLNFRLEQIRQSMIYGVRPTRTFREAATKYLVEVDKRSIGRDAQDLKSIDPFIGDLQLDRVHDGTLAAYIMHRKNEGRKTATINRTLAIVRRVLNLAARRWRDELGLTWLQTAPLLTLLKVNDARKPYPLTWEEQDRLFRELPGHLARMALFKVNTGTREREVTQLRWNWEIQVPEFGTSVFLIPAEFVKNGEDRLIVLNDVAKSVIESVRGNHPDRVFTYKGNPVTKIYNSAWKRAREEVGLDQVRVHDLKHTFGRRLRAAGVSFEDRQDLLGHKSGRITTHYSGAEIGNLIEAANRVLQKNPHKSPTLTVLRMQPKVVSV